MRRSKRNEQAINSLWDEVIKLRSFVDGLKRERMSEVERLFHDYNQAHKALVQERMEYGTFSTQVMSNYSRAREKLEDYLTRDDGQD